mgnify:CR=1 FL=1
MRRACADLDRIFHDNGGTELKFEHNSLLRVKIVFFRDFMRFNRFNSALISILTSVMILKMPRAVPVRVPCSRGSSRALAGVVASCSEFTFHFLLKFKRF